jgi:AraC-like DNA-binding protein
MSPLPQSVWASRYASIRTSDVDLARHVVETYFYSHHLDPLSRSPNLDAHFELLQFGPFALGDVAYGADVAMRTGDIGAYHVDIVVSGHVALQQGNRRFVADADNAAVLRPMDDIVVDRMSADCRLFALKIDRSTLERHLESLVGAPVVSPVRISPTIDVTTEPGRAWADIIRLLGDEITNRSGLVYQPIVAERLCEATVTGLLLISDHQYRDALVRPGRSPGPGSVRRSIDAIQAHPEIPFTARTLADIAGVSVRSLQEGFRRHVGTTPLAYLRDVRLERAHEDLLRADPRTATVAEIAQRWGFVHQSRFAAAYRARYHASPSKVLRSSVAVQIPQGLRGRDSEPHPVGGGEPTRIREAAPAGDLGDGHTGGVPPQVVSGTLEAEPT